MNVRIGRWAVVGGLVVSVAASGFASVSAGADTDVSDASATSAGDQAAAYDADAVLRVGYGTPPQRLDPHLECHIGCRVHWIPIFETLYDLNVDGRIEPLAAESLPEYSTDGLDLTIQLRDGRTFHDGTPLDAEAVKLSMERGQTVEGSTATALQLVDEIEVVDEYTVALHLTAPRPGFESELAGNAGALISPAALEDGRDLSLDPGDAGSGPFVLESLVPNESVTYRAVPDYWRDDRGLIGTVEVIAITDNNTGINALQSGQLDLVYASALLLEDERSEEIEAAGFAVTDSVTLNLHGILLRATSSGLDDLRVRQALALAIDREAINDALYAGACTPSSQIFDERTAAHVPDYDPFAYDPERARELLADAGFADGFDLEIVTVSGNPTSEDNAAIVQQMLAQIGVNVTLTPMTSPEGSAAFSAGDIAARSTVVTNLPDALGTLDFHFLPGGRTELIPPDEAAPLLELRSQLVSATPDEAPAVLEEMGRMVSDMALVIPICFQPQSWAHSPNVQGVDGMALTLLASGLDFRGLSMSES